MNPMLCFGFAPQPPSAPRNDVVVVPYCSSYFWDMTLASRPGHHFLQHPGLAYLLPCASVQAGVSFEQIQSGPEAVAQAHLPTQIVGYPV